MSVRFTLKDAAYCIIIVLMTLAIVIQRDELGYELYLNHPALMWAVILGSFTVLANLVFGIADIILRSLK